MAETYYSIKLSTLTEIGDAIRAKSGATEDIAVTSLATSILNLSPAEDVIEWDGTGTVVTPIEPEQPMTFTINGTSYQMENRMTWYAWTRSDYNTDSFACANENDYVYEAESTNKVTDADGNEVLGTTYIVEGGAYLIKAAATTFTFTIDGTTYTADSGMTWYEWVSSDYAPDSYSCESTESKVYPTGDTYIADSEGNAVIGSTVIAEGGAYSIEAAEDALAGTWVLNESTNAPQTAQTFHLSGSFYGRYDTDSEAVGSCSLKRIMLLTDNTKYLYFYNVTDSSAEPRSYTYLDSTSNYYYCILKANGTTYKSIRTSSNADVRTFTITSNLADVTNGSALLAWLQANATKQ